MTAASARKTDKFRRYRERKKSQGMREVRMWVPNVSAPGFQQALDQQIQRINASEDEREVTIFCELAAEEMWKEID